MAKRKKQELTYIFYNPNTDLEAYAEYLTKFFVDIYVKNHKDEIFKMIDELIKQKHACLNETDSIQDETTLITGDIDDIDCSTESKTNKKLDKNPKSYYFIIWFRIFNFKETAMRNLSRRLTEAIIKIGGIEYSIDKQIDINETELCLMYALDDGKSHSQREIADNWELPRTTLNTIVKRWEKEGFLTLKKISGKRREMEIRLTEKGTEKARNSLVLTYSAEDHALKKTIDRYSADFIEALEYYAEMLKVEANNA